MLPKIQWVTPPDFSVVNDPTDVSNNVLKWTKIALK